MDLDWLFVGFLIATGWHFGTTLFEIFVETVCRIVYGKKRRRSNARVTYPNYYDHCKRSKGN